MKDYPYLYFPEPPSFDLKAVIEEMNVGAALTMLKYGTCVKECPTSNKAELIQCKVTKRMVETGNYKGCEYQIGPDFFKEWGLDFTDYTKDLPGSDSINDAISDNAKYPFRYGTKKLYTYCLPDLSGGGALTQEAIEMFSRLF